MIRTLLVVLVALGLLAGLAVGVRRRTLCPLSAGLGLLAGAAWALVLAVT